MGGVQSPVFQAWLPAGSQAIDWVAHQSQALGLCAWAAGSQVTDQSALPPGVSGVGAQSADRGVHPPGVSGVGAQSADLGAHQPGFRCVLGLLIWCSQSRG